MNRGESDTLATTRATPGAILKGNDMKVRIASAAAFAVALTLGTGALAQDRVFFGIATGGTGGTYYPLGGMLAQLISNKVTIGGKKLSATAETAGASVANAQLLARKDIESAFVAADILDAAYTGKGQFEGKPVKNLRALGALYPEQVQLVVLASANVQSMKDLKGKSVSSGSPGSGQWQLLGDLLETYGMTRKDVGEDMSSFAQSVDKIKDGNLTATLITAGAPTSSISDLANARDIRIVPLAGPEIENAAQEAAVLRERPAAAQHVQGPDRAGEHARGDGDLGHARWRQRPDGVRSDQGAVREHRDAGTGAPQGQGDRAQDRAACRFRFRCIRARRSITARRASSSECDGSGRRSSRCSRVSRTRRASRSPGRTVRRSHTSRAATTALRSPTSTR